jgi:hypothetical protein
MKIEFKLEVCCISVDFDVKLVSRQRKKQKQKTRYNTNIIVMEEIF